jgi:gluconate:H+ symporter, GntP family
MEVFVMSGVSLIIAFVIAIILMIFAISKLKIHPFLSIMSVSLLLGLVAGIPLTDVKVDGVVQTQGLATVIGAGFSGTFTSIGIVIILGALIGTILEKTGAALKLADMTVKLVGKKRPELAMLIMGWVVSIPVFCDSGFVILNPIRKALVKKTMSSSVAMTVALSGGLYVSHVLIPPTPGPIAAANTLGVGDNLLLVIGLGVLCSIFPLIAGYFYAKYIGKKVKANDEADMNNEEIVQSYDELVKSYGKLPSGIMSLAPIIVPILLMGVSSVVAMMKVTGIFAEILTFLGTPIIALAAGTIFGIITLSSSKKMGEFYDLTNETLKVVGPILFVTAAGGVLGKVISVSGLVTFITDNATVFQAIGIFFPFLLAAILKTAQGSSTVAITTTAGILAPMLPVLGLNTPVLSVLTVMAIGAGAMVVSHANDSYFWVVTNFGAMTPDKGYKTQTVMTLVMGIAAIIEIFLLSLIF